MRLPALAILSCCLLGGVPALAQAADGPQAEAHTADIDKAALEKAIAAKSATIIDVNGSASYAKGHIPTAVDFEANKGNLAAVLPADKGALVVAYCGGPKCGAYRAAYDAAIKLGYTNVKHFSGGLSGWTADGGQLAK